MIKGFVTGSFRPFHKGHEALIDYAKQNCDLLTILVTVLPNEVIPYKHRLSWVLSTYLDDPKVTILADTMDEPPLKGDALSIWWGFYVKQKYGYFDRVFTSEDYGWVFAETMGAEHFSFNILRNLIPVSATAIREKPLTNWDYLNNFAKDYFVKKIAIVGTESTGKTVLSEQLAKYYNTTWAPEAGDAIVNNTEDVKDDMETLALIGAEHAKNIRRHTRLANKVLFVDTDMNITKSYAKFMCEKELSLEPWVEKANEMDLYIYLSADAPYVNENGRRLSLPKRQELDHSHRQQFEKANIKFEEFGFNGYEPRFKNIVNRIDLFLSQF